MRDRLNLSLPVEMIGRINDLANRKRVTRSAVVEAAVESFLSPDHADMQEAALTRRLDRLSRQFARLERDKRITTETQALFVRFWLTVTPPIPPEDQASAQAKPTDGSADLPLRRGRKTVTQVHRYGLRRARRAESFTQKATA